MNREGKLQKQSSGRWAIVYDENPHDYDELTSGQVAEIFILGIWKRIRIEFNGHTNEYYAYSDEIVPLKDGLLARLP